MTVDELMKAAFGRPRDPRSDEYKAGCRALLARKIEGTPMQCPYPMGTAQADAWFAGTDEGHGIISSRRALQKEGSALQPNGDEHANKNG